MIPLVFAALLAAQAPSPPPQPQTFRSGTAVVEVDVRVFKDGRFVMDLGPDDFVLTEDGAPQKIQSVVLVGAQATGAHPSTPETPSPPRPSAPLAPAASPAPAVWLFLFDSNHLSAGGLQRTREAVVKFIAERWRQGDIGGVVVDGKMANNRLTSDREELRAAAQAVKMPGDLRSRQLEMTRDWPRFQDEYEVIRVAADNDRDTIERLVARACSDDPDACRRAAPDLAVREKAGRLFGDIQRATLSTLTTVTALANGLDRMPGAKTVVFLSEGFVAEKLESQVRQAVGLAARAGARFYAIDARGLNRGSQATMIDQIAADSAIGGGSHFDAQVDGTNSLAVDTGGFAIRNENNFGRALDEIQQDAGTYYLIAYSPANAAFDGKYRTIAVNVARPGVKVRARRGYVALPPARMTTDAIGPGGPARATGPTSPVSASAPAPLTPAPPPSEAPEAPHATPPAGVVAPTVAPSPASASASLARLAPTGPSAGDSPAATAGWVAYQRGDVESAARALATAAAAPDARPWVHYALGLSRYALQHYRDAAEAWERVRRAVPEFEPVYFSLADAYGQQHDEGTAIKTLRDAEQRWPQDPEVSDAIGVIQVRRGALDAAIDSFERATKVGPADALGYFNLARACQMRLLKSQRYDTRMERWVGGETDRRRAIEGFKKYLELGGPYERQAKEALAALEWK